MTLGCLLAAGARVEAGEPLFDVVLASATGETRLERFRGKPTVLLYEDREAQTANQPLKDELVRRAREAGLLERANVVGVANLAAFDFAPARRFAVKGVREAEAKYGLPILIDWDRALPRSPLRLPAEGASVLLFDAQGRIVFRAQGALDADGRARLLRLLDALLDQRAGTSSSNPPAPSR